MIIEKHRQSSISLYLSVIFLGCTCSHPAISQTVPANQVTPRAQGRINPVSLDHLYWHFLAYQNHLDTRADEQEAQGKDGSWLRGRLQAMLNLSDADFAPIRSASKRLVGKMKVRDEKVASIVAGGKTPFAQQQLSALVTEREADIQAEKAYLQQALGPEKTAEFERVLTQMFSPKPVAVQIQPANPQPAMVVQP
jgi:hypothetical protein